MNVRKASRFVLSCVAPAMLAACGGSQAPMSWPGPMLRAVASAVYADTGMSWMAVDSKRIKRLLYVSAQEGNVYVYNFDTGTEVGNLTDIPGNPKGQCVDKRGNIWITAAYGYNGSVTEYPHGATHALQSLSTQGSPIGCAIDPTTGNLAVVTSTTEDYSGSILIFDTKSGNHATYSNGDCLDMGTPGYDDEGNLYVEGRSSSWRGICELPERAHKLVTRSTNVNGVAQQGVMWDGKYLTLTVVPPYRAHLTAIYRVMSKGASGKLVAVGETFLHDRACGGISIAQPFIVGKKNTPANEEQGTVVVGGNGACKSRFDFWRYPAGGKPLRELPDAPETSYGQSVSIRE